MRTLKFRAWCKTLRQPELRSFTLDDIQMGAFALHPEDEVMQFTGLLDRNGKEIYEGDIVHRTVPNPPQDDLRKVEWVNKHHLNGWNVAQGLYWEVIGNIYENPELLTPHT